MVVMNRAVDRPVLDALYSFKVHPSREDALKALYNSRVQEASLQVAQLMREIARSEDDVRLVKRKSLVNYRRFYVGAVGIGLIMSGNTEVPYGWWVFPAFNTKPSKPACKFCAEMRIFRAAREVNCALIGGLTIVGENQPDGRSGKLRVNLDPCGECRDCMRHPDNIGRLHKNTLIHTSRPLSQLSRVEPLHEMMAAHAEKWPRTTKS